MTLVALVAISALAVLPAPHVHQRTSGEILIHRHLVASIDQHVGLENGDHHDGIPTLEPAFTFVRTVHIEAPSVLEQLLLIVPPIVGVRRPALFDALVVRGPPPRVLSSRGPPL